MKCTYALTTLMWLTSFYHASDLLAQSTSDWLPVSLSAGAPSAVSGPLTPSIGASYLSVDLVTCRVYQKSNWWTNLVEKDRVGVVDATLFGKISGRVFEEVRTSGPIELRKNDAQVDVGWRQEIVRQLPTTYSNLQLRIRISKSAKDGLGALLGTLSEISSRTPPLQVSQSALGIVSATKAVAAFLFHERLLVQKLTSTMTFPASGNSLPAGFYVSFASDSADEYKPYLPTPNSTGSGLVWNGYQLLSSGQPVGKLTYFLVRVSYGMKVFDDPLTSLSFSDVKPWAALYQVGRLKINAIVKESDLPEIQDQIRSHFFNATTLLFADPDYINAEREGIDKTVREDTEKKLVERIDRFREQEAMAMPASRQKAKAEPASQPAPGVSAPRPSQSKGLLMGPRDSQGIRILEEIQVEDLQKRIQLPRD